ncbi:MAG TPA: hypothetical protein VEU77_06600 [Candidatus Acidoferrales bacterium]|nr:hypothetical protein [Candidatus Acidoferrales bacterium]
MGKLVETAVERVDHSESLRMALLSGLSFILGLVFLALLVADEAHAAL